MAGDTSNVHPSNSIVVDSINKHVRTKNVETATNVYPGRLLEVGTNDDDVVVNAGTTPPCGWAGYLDTTKKWRPATKATIYVITAKIAQLNGAGMVLLGKLAPGCTITVGDLLTQAPDGMLTEGTAGTDDIVAVAVEAVTSGPAAITGTDILVRSRI